MIFPVLVKMHPQFILLIEVDYELQQEIIYSMLLSVATIIFMLIKEAAKSKYFGSFLNYCLRKLKMKPMPVDLVLQSELLKKGIQKKAIKM